MPNYCTYDMKVKAKNKENLLEFIKIIQSDYDYDNNKFTAARHLWRVFEANCEEDEIEESEDCFSIIISFINLLFSFVQKISQFAIIICSIKRSINNFLNLFVIKLFFKLVYNGT